MMASIIRIGPGRWMEYKNLRLDALKNEPKAFCSSTEKEMDFSETEWMGRCENALFAEIDGVLVGMIVAIAPVDGMSETGNIYGFYVKKGFRDSGIGSSLIDAAVEDLGQNKHIHKVRVSVNPTQTAAVHLYKKAGFETIAVVINESCNPEFQTEQVMEKNI